MSSQNNLDIAFCVDNTGSMSTYIKQVQENIVKIIQQIVQSEKANVRVALVHYRDHTDDYLVKAHEFTDDIKKVVGYVNQMAAAGGGDGPEAVAPAFQALNKLEWRKASTKITIFIADAPPHGIGEHGDSYPNGDPNGIDPLEEVGKLTTKEIIIYSVGCEPGINSFINARAFMKGVSDTTGGKYLPLGQVKILADVIIYGAREELNLDKYADEIEKEVNMIQQTTPTMSAPAVYAQAATNLAAKGVNTPQMSVDNLLSADAFTGSAAFRTPTLKTAREQLNIKDSALGGYPSFAAPSPYVSASAYGAPPSPVAASAFSFSSVASPAPSYAADPFAAYPAAPSYATAPSPYNGASMTSQAVQYQVSPISTEQVQRLYERKQNSKSS